jgi:hypothetical protein
MCCAKSGYGVMSAAVAECSTRKWQGSERTHLFSREWGRDGLSGGAMKRFVMSAKNWSWPTVDRALVGQCHFTPNVSC